MTNVIKRVVLFILLGVTGIFSAVSFAETRPDFSHGTSPKWYYVKFKAGGVYLTGHGAGRGLTVEPLTEGSNQQWMLEGNEKKFYLVSRDNYYVTIANNGGWDEKKNNCPAVGDAVKKEGFKLHKSIHHTYKGSYEIESTTFGQKCLNTWGGIGAGTPIGVWYTDDSNNAVEFIPADQPRFSVSGVTNYSPAEINTLWYTQPANNYGSANAWMEYSLPIGNGQLGASVFGGVKNDEIIFNEKTLWTGTSKSVGTDGNRNEYGSYQVFGALHIEDQNALGSVTNYLRDLNLANATASMSYTHDGVDYKREYIVSEPDKVVATRLSATADGKINIKISLSPKMTQGTRPVSVKYDNGEAHFAGKLDVVSFDARMKVVAEGGKVQTNAHDIMVSNANEVLIVLAAGTDFDNSKPQFVSGKENLLNEMDSRVEKAAAKKWNALYKAHVDDYKGFYNRVKLNFTGAENTMPTDKLVDAYQRGTTQNTLMLEQLYFNYGRYLEISSSRGVDLPSNLQGIWTNENKAAWNADIHANINVQMNYWPAEITNMSEMHEPFLNYIIKMAKSEPWIRYAKESKQNRGWTCYTENNIFGGVGVWAHNYVIVNAWYCTHLWQHYRYTQDKAFLEKAFPAMLSATQFWLDRLIYKNGQYLCPKEMSPEHGPKEEDGVAHAQQLVWELFDNTLKAVNILGESVIPASDLKDLRDKFSKLDKGLATEQGPRGQQLLREWKYSEYTAGQNGHRHLSHLMCLYPFSQVNSNSEFFQPAINSLIHRGDPSTGWSMGWKINLWARALDGNHAHSILKMALRHSTSFAMDESKGGIYYNLFDSHAPFQIDGNFGACAGIAEMLFQSHSDVLHFLPALPDAWSNGSVSGLKGVGNFTVGVVWNQGKAAQLTINNVKGQKCLVKCTRANKAIDEVSVVVGGKSVKPIAKGDGVFEIPSTAGDEIVIDFNKEPGTRPEAVYSGQCGEQLKWNLDKVTGVMTISGTGAMYDYSSEEPAPWTEVAAEVKSIVFPEGITHIGNNAFVSCTQSMEVRFHNNDVTIGAGAFSSSIKAVLEVDDADYAASAFPLTENSYNEIIYHRDLDDGKWGTVILPFSLNAETASWYDFYELDFVEENTLTFRYVKQPLANQPYMYKNAMGIHRTQMVSDKSTTIDANAAFSHQAGVWTMLGRFAPLEISSQYDLLRTYVLSNGKIFNSTKSVKVRPFRAYFTGPDYNSLPAKSFRVVIADEDGEMTDITEVLLDEASENSEIYDIAGRRVWQTVPGHIYIQNGKKFIAR